MLARFAVGWAAALCLLGSASGTLAAESQHSVVIFGDTQTLVNQNDKDYQKFKQMVRWVIDNQKAQNIDFALHVGDAINFGHHMPAPPSCENAPSKSMAECRAGTKSCRVPTPPGCFESHKACMSCSDTLRRVQREWDRFNREWHRLDGVVPWAIARGNHDNPGDTPGEPAGFVQYYGAEALADLPGYLESCPRCTGPGGSCCVHADAHAWQFSLGPQPVLVVAPSWRPGPGQIRWVRDVLERHADTPTILLSHALCEQCKPDPNTRSLINEVVRNEAVAGNVFMTASGHWVIDQKTLDRRPPRPAVRVIFNYQRGSEPYLALVRFTFEGGQVTAVEAFTIDPTSGSAQPLPRGHLKRTPFSLTDGG
jgi:hypothetical protein